MSFRKINAKLLLMHLVATIFLVFSFRQFYSLTDLEVVKNLQTKTVSEWTEMYIAEPALGQRVYSFSYGNTVATYTALIIAFAVSLLISLRSKLFWINSLLVLIVSFILIRFDFLTLKIIKNVLNSPGKLFQSMGFEFTFIVNGILLFAFGMVLFWKSRSNKSVTQKV